MRSMVVVTFLAVGLSVASEAWAQDHAIPTTEPQDPQGEVADQRLEVANKNMVYAAERLDQAAQSGHQQAIQGAFDESRKTIEDVRKLFIDLPQEERALYEDALLNAEQALNGEDPRKAADAMRTLQQRVLELVQARG